MSIVDGVGIPGCFDCAEIFSIIGVTDGVGGTTGNGTGFPSGVDCFDGVVDVFDVVYCFGGGIGIRSRVTPQIENLL